MLAKKYMDRIKSLLSFVTATGSLPGTKKAHQPKVRMGARHRKFTTSTRIHRRREEARARVARISNKNAAKRNWAKSLERMNCS